MNVPFARLVLFIVAFSPFCWISAAQAQVTLWDSGPPKQVLFNGNATFLGYSSGNVAATLPQRWAAHPFVVAGSPWVVTQINADWFVVAGQEAADVRYIIFKWHPSGRDTAPNLPELVEQGVLGAFLQGTDDPDVPGAEDWLHSYATCIEIAPGNYYLTIYADGIGPGNTTGFSNAAWLCGADGGWEPGQVPGDGSAAANERNYMWRSAMFPTPGFTMYAPSNVQPLDGAQDLEDRWNCAFTMIGYNTAVGDCNNNGTPDVCEPDCNDNGVADPCDISGPTSEDCNNNNTPDECEPGGDCNNNNTPDICEPGYVDCNTNGNNDSCDIAPGTATSNDCDSNGTPDECDGDCNTNGVGDACDAAGATSEDCDSDGVPDECEPDCNENGTADDCDITSGFSEDCQPNGFPDECDLLGVVVFDQTFIPTDLVNIVASDNSLNPPDPVNGPIQVSADDFILAEPLTFDGVICIGFYPDAGSAGDGTQDSFTVRFWSDVFGNPSTVEATFDVTAAAGEVERVDISGGTGGFAYFIDLPSDVTLPAGNHWFEIFHTTPNSAAPGDWGLGFTDGGGGIDETPIAAIEIPELWNFFYPDLADEHVIMGLYATSADDNANNIPDECEVACTLSGDMDGSGGVDGDDINCYVSCTISGSPSTGCSSCDCANLSVAAFVAALLN